MKKLIAVIIALMLAVFASVFAFAKPTETGTLEPIFCVNPLYEGVVSVKKPEQKFENGINAYGTTYYTDIADVGAAAREHLKNRAETFTVGYKTKNFDGTGEMFGLICGDILSYAFMHTGVSDEGDYIQWHWEHYEAGASYSYNGTYYSIGITFYFDYYTTAAQEEAVTEKLEEVYEELQLEDKNDYYKICAIYDYICDNVVYDYANLNNENYKLQYTAYAALINGTSVCQGYSNLFYRMALDWGVDARLIAGDAGGPHAWNIVKMGDYYYNLDSTWDEGLRPNYMWFLKCPDTFVNHYRDYEYETAEFHAAYPMGATDYVYNESDFEDSNLIASGYCGGEGDGKNLKWGIDKDGVLTISGEGKMADYDMEVAPWYEHAEKVKKLVLEEGMTTIGKCAFGGLENASGELIIPNTVTEIYNHAFAQCIGFEGNLIIPDGVIVIGESAFNGCAGFDGNLLLPDGLEEIGEYAFYECENIEGGLVIPDSVTTLGSYAFKGCAGFNGNLTIGSGLEKITTKAFAETGFTGDLIIPDTVTEIHSLSFNKCKGFDGSLYIGNGVEYVGVSSFQDCSGFTGELVIGENVTSIRDDAFSGCSGFTGDIIIPDSVVYINFGAFEGCTGFNGELVLGKNVKEISGRAFYNCTGLSEEVFIPKSVNKMSTGTFGLCGIDKFYFEGDAPKIGGATFEKEKDTIYYNANNKTWVLEYGKWNDYKAVSYIVNGDLNGDAEQTVEDVYMIRLAVAKVAKLTEEQKDAADLDGDGKITAIDANILRKYILGIIPEIPVAVDD